MANYYLSSVKYAALPQWAASTAYSVGDYVRNLAPVAASQQRVFKCTTAGTSGASEPSWNTGDGQTTVSGTATFTQVAGRESEQLSGDWRAPLPTMAAAVALVPGGSVLYVSDDHLESYAAATNFNTPNAQAVICVDAGSTIPPTEAEFSRGATFKTTGNNGLSFIHLAPVIGWNFESGDGGTTTGGNMNFNNTAIYENCRFKLATTSASGIIALGPSTLSRGTLEFRRDCRFQPVNAGQICQLGFSEVLMRDCPNLVDVSLATPSSNFFGWSSSNGQRGSYTFRNCDLSMLTLISLPNVGTVSVENCKLNASLSLPSPTGIYKGLVNPVKFHNSTSSTSDTMAFIERGPYANIELDKVAYRDNGASDGVEKFAWKITTKTDNDREYNRIRLPKISKRVNSAGSPMTFTVEALIATSASMSVTRAKLWGEFEVLTAGTSPVAETKSTRTSMIDATALQTSTESWGAGAPERANNASVTAGYVFKSAANPGRVFVVSGSGTLASSLPGAYATAVDGDTFVDGSANIRCCKRIKFEVTATPARRGFAHFYLQCQLAASEVLYLDPKMKVV